MQQKTDVPIMCPICHTSPPRKHRQVGEFIVWKCLQCELLWVPDVDGKILEKFYEQEYFKSTDSTIGYHDYVEDEEILRLNARYIIRNIPPLQMNRPQVLDIGCAHGFMMDEFRKAGWETYGVEMSQLAVEYGKNILKLNLFHGSVFEARYKNSQFDVVIIIGSIEHFPNPIAVIKEANRVLKAGGYIAITTINIKGLVRLYDIKPPEHLYYFSDRNLSLLLENNGFKVEKSLPYWCHYHLSEALCRAFRLVFNFDFRIEHLAEKIPFLKTPMKVPTNEMFMLAQKVTDINKP